MTSCSPCLPGTYQTGIGAVSASSSLCAAGTYQNRSGATACVVCSAGTYQSGFGMTSCSPCLPGSFLTGAWLAGAVLVGSQACISCPAGTYQTGNGLSSCTICPSGKFQTGIGMALLENCSLCGAGTYSSVLGVGTSEECTPCSAGTYQTGVLMTSAAKCLVCAAGTFGTGTGSSYQTNCIMCPAGSYQSGLGQTSEVACVQCTAGEYPAAANASHCGSGPASGNDSMTLYLTIAGLVGCAGLVTLVYAIQGSGSHGNSHKKKKHGVSVKRPKIKFRDSEAADSDSSKSSEDNNDRKAPSLAGIVDAGMPSLLLNGYAIQGSGSHGNSHKKKKHGVSVKRPKIKFRDSEAADSDSSRSLEGDNAKNAPSLAGIVDAGLPSLRLWGQGWGRLPIPVHTAPVISEHPRVTVTADLVYGVWNSAMPESVSNDQPSLLLALPILEPMLQTMGAQSRISFTSPVHSQSPDTLTFSARA